MVGLRPRFIVATSDKRLQVFKLLKGNWKCGVGECSGDLTASIFKFVNLDLKSFASRR